jgi:hypothetical protein
MDTHGAYRTFLQSRRKNDDLYGGGRVRREEVLPLVDPNTASSSSLVATRGTNGGTYGAWVVLTLFSASSVLLLVVAIGIDRWFATDDGHAGLMSNGCSDEQRKCDGLRQTILTILIQLIVVVTLSAVLQHNAILWSALCAVKIGLIIVTIVQVFDLRDRLDPEAIRLGISARLSIGALGLDIAASGCLIAGGFIGRWTKL